MEGQRSSAMPAQVAERLRIGLNRTLQTSVQLQAARPAVAPAEAKGALVTVVGQALGGDAAVPARKISCYNDMT